jgi:hypothetical protein
MMWLVRCAALACLTLAATSTTGASDVRFEAIEIYVDSGATPLAAWQVELTEANGLMRIAGVENGADKAFAAAPHYDRSTVEAGDADRVIVAAYSLLPEGDLPRGQTRVTTVHVQLAGSGEPQYNLRLVAAGDAAGHPIVARASMLER